MMSLMTLEEMAVEDRQSMISIGKDMEIPMEQAPAATGLIVIAGRSQGW
jgi:hypothetical protein